MTDESWKAAKAAPEYEAWLKSAGRDMTQRTVYDYSLTIRDLLAAHPDKETSEFTTDDCQQLLDSYSEKGRPVRRAALRSFFRPLYMRGAIPTNPVDRVHVPEVRKQASPEVFTEAEVGRLYALDSPHGPLLVLMIDCGLRKRECRALRRRDIDLDREYLDVRSRAERHVPLSARARQAVQELDEKEALAAGDHLWGTRPGGGTVVHRETPISQTAFQGWYREALRKAGVPHREARTTYRTFEHRSKLGAAAGTPASVDRDLLRRLDALEPQLAASYTQAHIDLVDKTRLSFLGPAGEVREVMRAVIHRLAPDDDVRAQSWYVGHEGRPTQAERIRHILEARSESATEAAEIVDAKVAALGRKLYGRASRALHSGAQREEVRKIVGYVEAVLSEILPA